jgi:TolA-binding protein
LRRAGSRKAKGQNDAAKRAFEQVISQYKMSSFGFEAQQELATLNKAEKKD